jgi:hypothetical protein
MAASAAPSILRQPTRAHVPARSHSR